VQRQRALAGALVVLPVGVRAQHEVARGAVGGHRHHRRDVLALSLHVAGQAVGSWVPAKDDGDGGVDAARLGVAARRGARLVGGDRHP
jgi:hypothetical protein